MVSPRISMGASGATDFCDRDCGGGLSYLDFAAGLLWIFNAHSRIRSGRLFGPTGALLVDSHFAFPSPGGGSPIDRRDFLARIFSSLSDRGRLRSRSVWEIFLAIIHCRDRALRLLTFQSGLGGRVVCRRAL